MIKSDRGCMRGVLKSPGGKKKRKRKELDALIGRSHRESGTRGSRGPSRSGLSHQNQCHYGFVEEDYWSWGNLGRKLYCCSHEKETSTCNALWKICTILLIIICLIASGSITWLFMDIKEQTESLRKELDEGVQDVLPEEIRKLHTLLQKNETEIENHLHRVAQRLSNFYHEISGMQTDVLILEEKLETFPSQDLISNAQQRAITAIEGFKADIMEMESSTSNIVNQQSGIKKIIATMTATISLFYSNLQDLKRLTSLAPTSGGSGKNDLVNLINEKFHLEIQAFNNTTFPQVNWLSYDLQNAQKATSSLADGLRHLNITLKTTLRELKLQSLELCKLQNDSKKWNNTIEGIKILESKLADLLKSL